MFPTGATIYRMMKRPPPSKVASRIFLIFIPDAAPRVTICRPRPQTSLIPFAGHAATGALRSATRRRDGHGNTSDLTIIPLRPTLSNSAEFPPSFGHHSLPRHNQRRTSAAAPAGPIPPARPNGRPGRLPVHPDASLRQQPANNPPFGEFRALAPTTHAGHDR